MLGFNEYGIVTVLFLSFLYTGVSAKKKGKREVKLRNKNYVAVPVAEIPADTLILDLNVNDISEINSTDLQKLVSLEELSMSTNKLITFPNLSAVGSTLRILKLESNKMLDIPENVLTPLVALEELNIGHNNLTVIPNLKKLGNLWNLRLEGNQINTPTRKNFRGLSLKELSLGSNGITFFPDLIFVRKTLQVLLIEGNSITYIPEHLLDQMVALTQLSLHKNQLSTIPDVKGPGKTLVKLRLEENNFRQFPKISNIGRNLQYLYINYNLMNRIPPENFVFENRNESVVLVIDLEFNPIKTLPPVVGTSLEGCEIRLSDTSMVCDMNLAWLTFLPKSTYIEDGSVCASPPQLQNMEIGHLKLSDLESTLPKDKPKVLSSFSHLIFNNIYSNSLPMLTTHVQSPLECLMFCTVTPGCVYVNYDTGLSSGVGHLCHYSSPLEGQMLDKPSSETGWKYYSVNSANQLNGY